MGTLEIFLITLVLTIAIMVASWMFAVKVENFSLVDAVWSWCFLIHAGLFFGMADGYGPRKILFLAMIGLWSTRLAYYLTRRIAGHHPAEDTRYIQLRKEYGANYKTRFLYFFMMQAGSVSLLTLPFIFAFKNQTPEIALVEWIGLGVWAVSVIGETISDAQMSKFRSIPTNKGQVCNIGLWNYSRHPNYFFESCIWWGFFITMLGTQGLWWGVYAPAIILFLLLKVTGVPLSEEQSLKSRGDLYRRYQERTSVFVPWFPKKG